MLPPHATRLELRIAREEAAKALRRAEELEHLAITAEADAIAAQQVVDYLLKRSQSPPVATTPPDTEYKY